MGQPAGTIFDTGVTQDFLPELWADLIYKYFEEKNQEIQKEIITNIKELMSLVKKNEIKCFLSNEADSLDCYIEIHAGAGGTESQDWANMLRRMYLKWSDNKKFCLVL